MKILNILKKVQISLKYILRELAQGCTILLTACLYPLITIFSLIDAIVKNYTNMDQAPNQQDLDELPEPEHEHEAEHQHHPFAMAMDIDDSDDHDSDQEEEEEEDGDDDDDDDDEEVEVEEDSSSDESDMVTPTEEVLKDTTLDVDFVYSKWHKCNIKRMFYFKPFCLTRDKFKKKFKTIGVPAPRSGHRIIANASNLYSLGGYNPRSAVSAAMYGRCMLFQELWRYNFATRRWKLLMNGESFPNMPRELASNALVMYNNVLISHGGTGYPFGESCSNDCYVFATGEKPILARLNVSGDLPAPLYGPAIVIHNDYLYTIGGTTGFDYSCDVYRLNLLTKVWENMYISRPEMRESDPEGRYRHEIVYDGDYIYVLGGGTALNVYDLQRIPAFNLNTNRWEFFDTLPDRTVLHEVAASAEIPDGNAGFPKPRKCFTCVQHKMDNGDIEAFITGGLQGDASTYFADVWKLNMRSMQWTLIRTANLPKALYFHSAADTGHGCMYIFGGIEYDKKEVRRRNRVYKMWMTIPKLSEMCWEAITYYNEHLCTYNRKALLSMGIPKHFVERVEFLPTNFESEKGDRTSLAVYNSV